MSEEKTTTKANLWTPGRIIATVVVVVLVATIGYTIFSGGPSVKRDSNVALPGSAASASVDVLPDFDVPTLDGRAIKLSDYRGKVLVADFWATWCPPCKKEVPQLVRIASANRDRGLEVVGLHIDDQGRSTPEAIRAFINQYGVNYTVGMASADMFTAYLGEETAIPQTLVFGRDGKLVTHLVGYSESHARELEVAVNRALSGT